MKRRIAVSVLLTRDLNSREAFLATRAPQLVFFGGYQAFPGGTLDEEDSQVEVRGLSGAHLEQDSEMAVFIAAAARELFEETGLWVGRGGAAPESGRRERYRRGLLEGAMQFSDILRDEGQYVDAADFEPVCRIMTPPFTPVRYDTWFFRHRLRQDQEIEIWPGELLDGAFVDPDEALAAWSRGDILIVPPVIIMLRMLAAGQPSDFLGSVRELTASYARGKLHQVYFSPGILLAPLATHTRPPATHTNAYLVGHDELYLVDPGPTDSAEQSLLWELIDELQAEGRRLRGVLLTHSHPDHTGAAGACRRRYQVPVLAHPLAGGDESINEGDRIPLGTAPDGRDGWELEVYHLPGHARDHLAFRENRYGSVLAGDLVSTLSSILIDPAEGDLTTYLKSLQRLHDLTEGHLYPAHGPPARDGRRTVARQIRHRRRREEQILEALEAGPLSVDALLEKVYAGTPEPLMALARRSLLAGIQKLALESRLVESSGTITRLE